jgi:solute carrier family 13 (sodium-dependent dicarboxylate transporter), member 2/3/5
MEASVRAIALAVLGKDTTSRRSVVYSGLALFVYLAARLFPPAPGLTDACQAILGVALAGVLLWITEALPLGLTALVLLTLLGTVPAIPSSGTFAGLGTPVVFFLIGSVAIATAVEATGLAGRIAAVLVRRARGSPRRLYVHMLTILPVLAFVLPSAISRNAVLIPAYQRSLAAMNIGANDRTGRALMLALGVLNPLASSALLTGGITSITASSVIGGFSWLRWFCLMAVPYYALLCFGGIALWLMVGPFEEAPEAAGAAVTAKPFSWSEIWTIAVLLLASLLWLTDFVHGWSPAIPALLAAILLICPKIGVIGWKEFEGRLSWGVILTVGASLSLAQAVIQSGAAAWVGREFLGLSTSLIDFPFALLGTIIIAVAIVHIGITNLAACIALLIPTTMTVAQAAGLNPVVCGLIVTIVVDSVILYPAQTASNLLAYESGYFNPADVGRFGIIMLGLAMLVGLGIAVPYWSMIGLPLTLH